MKLLLPEAVAPEVVLAIGAHPDDVGFRCAGTLPAWGHYRGGCGGFDSRLPRDSVKQLRREEQRAAARVVGARDVVFLGYEDGGLGLSLALRRDLAALIRRIPPGLCTVSRTDATEAAPSEDSSETRVFVESSG